MNLNINQIKAIFAARGLTLYADGRINLFAFRSTRVVNGYDDRFYTAHCKKVFVFSNFGNFYEDRWTIESYRCTVDPGVTQLTNPTFPEAQKRGTGILAEHETYWFGWAKIGVGEGRHDCLIQISDVKAYRDNNRDRKFDFVNLEKGQYGCCIHCFGIYGKSEVVNNRSAMCTDFHDWGAYSTGFLPEAKKYPSVADHDGLYPYTLFLESDITAVL